MFCGCGRFRFVVRVIYGTAVLTDLMNKFLGGQYHQLC